MKWHCVSISDPDFMEIVKIKGTLGYASINEFVHEAVKAYLDKKRWDYERKLEQVEDAIVEKHEVGEESVEHAFDKKVI